MEHVWEPSQWGMVFTRSEAWKLALGARALRVTRQEGETSIPLSRLSVAVDKGIFWSKVTLTDDNTVTATLNGIPNRFAIEFKERVHQTLVALRKREADQAKIQRFNEQLPRILHWSRRTTEEMNSLWEGKRWLTEEHIVRWKQTKPSVSLAFTDPVLATHVAHRPKGEQTALSFWQRDTREAAQEQNKRLVERELVDCKDFFDRVEKTPLTEEQDRAVLCFDNRVLVVASAGSGKTSTMVAKAGYALHRELFDSSELLLLAFNADAAEELQTRIRDRLNPLGLAGDSIRARTFHAFGLDVIGQATGARPTLAPWLDQGQDLTHLQGLISQLKADDSSFASRWNLFRVVLGRDLPAFGKEEEAPEDWEKSTGKEGFRTLDGKIVKSQGERLIADWLYYNGVNYEYERSYPVNTADAQHRQYHPDFYYPDIDTYHEHWALDAAGNPPQKFHGYRESMLWKKALHEKNGTQLIETTMADLWSGRAFDILEKELTRRGIKLDPNPHRPPLGRKVLEDKDLVRTFRTFMLHAKSNCLNDEELSKRAKENAAGAFLYRHELFLGLFKQIRLAWEKELAEHQVIDFEDMLIRATDLLESGAYDPGYKLVMLDEFQDASQARVRLARALVNAPGRHLFAVGDDWQSINRFAGADLSAMTSFEAWFGDGHVLRLERTFRCPQALCDVAGKFVQANPVQLKKRVVSQTPANGPAVRAIEVANEDQVKGALLKLWQEIHQDLVAGRLAPSQGNKVSIYLLGRYRRDECYLPNWAHLSDRLDVRFQTVHGSKGLEADYVFLPRLVSGYYSFPSTITDDPVLLLALPAGDDFPFAEERRLFYVALTRARRNVTLMTIQHQHSLFLAELRKTMNLEVTNLEGESSRSTPCSDPKCNGTLIPRRGRYGMFLGCTNYPRCKETARISR
jgi:DNA helicase-4